MANEIMDWLRDWWVYILTTGSAAAVFFFVRQIAIPWLKKLAEVIERILPNGGTSITDTVLRIELGIKLLAADQLATMHLSRSPWFKADQNGHCVYVNREYTNLSGLHYKDCLGNGWVRAIHPEDRARVKSEWENCMQSGTEFTVDFRWQNQKSGHEMTCTCNATITRIDGQMKGAVGVILINDVFSFDTPKLN